MTRKDELLAAFDEAWSHEWESVERAIDGVTDEEARYQAPIYADDEAEDGMPPPGTVLWHLAHLAVCVRHYADAIRSRPNPAPERVAPNASTVAEAIQSFIDARRYLRDTTEALSEEDLDAPLRSGTSVIELIRASIRHDVWHSAQIKVARRLYKHR